MKTKHSPGPWSASSAYGDGSAVWITPNKGAAMVLQGAKCLRTDTVKYPQISVNELQANARLIASAPDLLEALQDIADYPEHDTVEMRRIARAAILKATQ